MAWSHKSKIATQYEQGRILTHAGDQVLVGSSEDEVLIWQAEGDTWQRKALITGAWNNKIKIAA